MKRAPRLHFSFRSPFSWMAVERLRSVVPDALRRIEFVPYWDPDPVTERLLAQRGAEFHYVQMSKAKHLYILHDTKRLARRLGLPMRWPIDRDPWWEVPHLAWLLARRLGAAEEFYSAVVAARWEQGRDVCQPDAIRELAVSMGLDSERLGCATEDPEIRAEAVDCLVAAYEDDIFGVPYFRFGRHRFWGFDRVDDFLAEYLPLLRVNGSAPVDRRPASVGGPGVPGELRSRVGTYDTDTAGGCG
ncbi:MAG: 2-hydroxychromene-2-carboxylate isomerase [Pseudonocardiaceae bacterium]